MGFLIETKHKECVSALGCGFIIGNPDRKIQEKEKDGKKYVRFYVSVTYGYSWRTHKKEREKIIIEVNEKAVSHAMYEKAKNLERKRALCFGGEIKEFEVNGDKYKIVYADLIAYVEEMANVERQYQKDVLERGNSKANTNEFDLEDEEYEF